MPRVSKYRPLTGEEIKVIELGRPVRVKNRVYGKDLILNSVKNLNRAAYNSHLAEIRIGSEVWRGNIEELLQVLRLV